MSELKHAPTDDPRTLPHAFQESRSLFASERLLCGWCNREIYNPLHDDQVKSGTEEQAGGRRG